MIFYKSIKCENVKIIFLPAQNVVKNGTLCKMVPYKMQVNKKKS